MEREHRVPLADGRHLACLELGDPAGKPVFYCHGYPGSRLEARLAAGAAAALGLRLLAPDRPGMGGSDFLPGRSIGAWAADTLELAQQLGVDRFAVVGVSGGGPYALACAAGLPGRVHGVALVSAAGPVDDWSATRGMITGNRLLLGLAAHWPPAADVAVDGLAALIRRHPRFYFEHMLAGVPAADKAVLEDPACRALLLESTAEALRRGGDGPARELVLLARPWDFAPAGISVPVRIWQGLADNIIPAAMARRLEHALPEVVSRYLPGEGHFSLIYRHHHSILADLCTC